MLQQHHRKIKAYSLDLRTKIVESVRRGVSNSETARGFGANRSMVGRYLKQLAYLPHYSPDPNTIEEAFSKVK